MCPSDGSNGLWAAGDHATAATTIALTITTVACTFYDLLVFYEILLHNVHSVTYLSECVRAQRERVW